MQDFYKNKKVLLSGHTGFKGAWLSQILVNWGADLTGYSLEPPTNPNLFEILELNSKMYSIIGDIRDLDKLKNIFDESKPEIVIHMAAQPLVRESYKNPVYTYETNVMGTVNVCECVRQSSSVKSFLNVTTDKVYENVEKSEGYKEDEKLDGFDPYSNSKSCSELVTHSYINSFFKNLDISTSTARAGNVIGGGDFAKDRIIPDCVRACINNEEIIIRNPYSTRPYQHVLEPLSMYLTIAKMQFIDGSYAGYYNVGPNDKDCVETGELVNIYCKYYNELRDENITWINKSDNGPHEANFLKLDNAKIKNTFNWQPTWGIEKAIEKTVEWVNCYLNEGNIIDCVNNQIDEFFNK
ncbi:MAG: CDP-glucose 4,6-dehydratase [Methanobrevibacter sp.]|nr:CDP-glucose 4,6-dehydratase [Methanobrevibacter sp.]